MQSSLFVLLAMLAAGPQDFFEIRVIDAESGRGVPLVELETTNHIRCYTDSAGRVAFHEPGLMGKEVYFHVRSHGYEFPEDGFGFRGQRLKTTPGGSATIRIRRINLAERLYRLTGGGIYRDTVLLGKAAPLKAPVLNGKVFGSDSVMTAVFGGRIYWFWGDTNRPSYPLGNFHTPGATAQLPSQGGLDPEQGVNLQYFTDESGFAKPTCKMPGAGPTWIDAVVVLKEDSGRERMFAKYAKIKPPLEVYQRGLVEFDAERKQFEKVQVFPDDALYYPNGHTFQHRDGDTDFVYFGWTLPWLRVPATASALADLKQYEAYTCFREGSTKDEYRLDRGDDGRLRFAWRANTLPLSPELAADLTKRKLLKPEESPYRLIDADSRKPLRIHRSSVAWNDFRDCWVMIATEIGGTSHLGEVWFCLADRPEGPWSRARKIVTHDNYTFYNPKQHPYLAKQKGRMIFFEGTYTTLFSGNDQPTPRYDYNQIMYRLDLADPRLSRAALSAE